MLLVDSYQSAVSGGIACPDSHLKRLSRKFLMVYSSMMKKMIKMIAKLTLLHQST
jgi:hypothetical protein